MTFCRGGRQTAVPLTSTSMISRISKVDLATGEERAGLLGDATIDEDLVSHSRCDQAVSITYWCGRVGRYSWSGSRGNPVVSG